MPPENAETSFETESGRIVIRQIEPADSELLGKAYDTWSVESRYHRFMLPPGRLTNDQLTYLTDVDHFDHEALVAYLEATREPVGVARYIRLTDSPTQAEVAVAVSDDWQGMGVGSALLARLRARATAAGISDFRAEILASNTPAHALMRKLDNPKNIDHLGGVDIMTGHLDPDGDDDAAR